MFDSRQGQQSSSSHKHQHHLWGPPSILLKSDGWSLSRGRSDRGVNLNTQLHLLPGIRMRVLMLSLTLAFMAWIETGTALLLAHKF